MRCFVKFENGVREGVHQSGGALGVAENLWELDLRWVCIECMSVGGRVGVVVYSEYSSAQYTGLDLTPPLVDSHLYRVDVRGTCLARGEQPGPAEFRVEAAGEVAAAVWVGMLQGRDSLVPTALHDTTEGHAPAHHRRELVGVSPRSRPRSTLGQ